MLFKSTSKEQNHGKKDIPSNPRPRKAILELLPDRGQTQDDRLPLLLSPRQQQLRPISDQLLFFFSKSRPFCPSLGMPLSLSLSLSDVWLDLKSPNRFQKVSQLNANTKQKRNRRKTKIKNKKNKQDEEPDRTPGVAFFAVSALWIEGNVYQDCHFEKTRTKSISFLIFHRLLVFFLSLLSSHLSRLDCFREPSITFVRC